MSKSENWFVKNLFGIVSLLITLSGLVAGYTKLQITVANLQEARIDKEQIRLISCEVVNDKLQLVNKDISFLSTRIDKLEESVRMLYRRNASDLVIQSTPK